MEKAGFLTTRLISLSSSLNILTPYLCNDNNNNNNKIIIIIIIIIIMIIIIINIIIIIMIIIIIVVVVIKNLSSNTHLKKSLHLI